MGRFDLEDLDDTPLALIREKLGPEEWRQAVCLYSGAQLTYSKDRLVALSGERNWRRICRWAMENRARKIPLLDS